MAGSHHGAAQEDIQLGYGMEQVRDDRACEDVVYALPWGWIAAG
jgi:hypothetical protein